MNATLKYLACILAGALLAAGCSNDPIFSAIEDEVELKDPTLRGYISSLVAFDGNLYAANGYFFVRNGGTGDWHSLSIPSGAYHCAQIATDGTDLYALFTGKNSTNFHSLQIYETATNSWTPVAVPTDMVWIGSGDGQVFAVSGTTDSYYVHAITAGVTSSALNAAALSEIPSTAGDYVASAEGVYFYHDTDKTLTILAGTPTDITGIDVHNDIHNNYLYAVNSSMAYQYNISTKVWTPYVIDVESPTTGITYLQSGSKNILLVASGSEDGGFGEVILDGVDSTTSTDAIAPGDTAASSVLESAESQYEGTVAKWAVRKVYAITDPALTGGNAYVLYASVYYPVYDGLWSYYSDTQTEWNRE